MNKQLNMWTHNPTEGSITGILITEPIILGWATRLTATAFVRDSCKRKWRVRTHLDVATKLLSLAVGDKIKLIGIKGDLCPGAWDNAKRQIVPSIIEMCL